MTLLKGSLKLAMCFAGYRVFVSSLDSAGGKMKCRTLVDRATSSSISTFEHARLTIDQKYHNNHNKSTPN